MAPQPQLSLHLDNPHRVFYSGSDITGKLCLSCSSSWTPRESLAIQLVGEGKVKATDIKRKTTYNWETNRREEWVKTTHNFEEKRFLDTVIQQPMSTTSAIPAGTHSFPFRFSLQEGLPSTFSGGRGKIRYFLRYRITASGSWPKDKYKSSDKNCTGIVILGLHYANSMPHCLGKRTFTCNRSNWISWGSRVDQNLSATLEYPRGAYVPGEVLPLSGVINNNTDKNIEAVVIHIEQKVSYTVEFTTTYIKNKYGCVRKRGIPARSTVQWTNEPFIIPPLPASGSNELFYNISIEYSLHIMFKIPGWCCDTAMKMERMSSGDGLLIANVPMELYCEKEGKNLPVRINTVSYSETPEPYKPGSAFGRFINSLTEFQFDREDTSGSNWGTESCVPKYPVFDLQRDSDILSKEFEIM